VTEPWVESASVLTATDLAAVLELVRQVTATDGASPISEHVLLRLRAGGRPTDRHVIGRDSAGRMIGYAYVDRADATVAVAEIAATSTEVAQQLVAAIETDGVPGLLVWARGQSSALVDVLDKLGYRRDRVLLQLRRPLSGELAEPVWPAGVTVRAFVPGQDEAAWLELNNTAFADHPDQSGWTLTDVTEREREPWFDPAGFFLAERSGALVGFHWTKVHPADSGRGREALGEVYVVGVSPVMQGQRLGSALTLLGIRYLRALGLATVILYVDESNPSAVHVYERLGFTRFDADTCFVRG
jgi:mycothiol synthase